MFPFDASAIKNVKYKYIQLKVCVNYIFIIWKWISHRFMYMMERPIKIILKDFSTYLPEYVNT